MSKLPIDHKKTAAESSKIQGRFGRLHIGSASALLQAQILSDSQAVLLALMERLHQQTWTTQALSDEMLAEYVGVSRNVVNKVRNKLNKCHLVKVNPVWRKGESRRKKANQLYTYTFLPPQAQAEIEVTESKPNHHLNQEITQPAGLKVKPIELETKPIGRNVKPNRLREAPSKPEPDRDSANLPRPLPRHFSRPPPRPDGEGEENQRQTDDTVQVEMANPPGTKIATAPAGPALSLLAGKILQAWHDSRWDRSTSAEEVAAFLAAIGTDDSTLDDRQVLEACQSLFSKDSQANYLTYYYKHPQGRVLIKTALGLDQDSVAAAAREQSNQKARADYQRLRARNSKLEKAPPPPLDQLMSTGKKKGERPGARKRLERLGQIRPVDG